MKVAMIEESATIPPPPSVPVSFPPSPFPSTQVKPADPASVDDDDVLSPDHTHPIGGGGGHGDGVLEDEDEPDHPAPRPGQTPHTGHTHTPNTVDFTGAAQKCRQMALDYHVKIGTSYQQPTVLGRLPADLIPVWDALLCEHRVVPQDKRLDPFVCAVLGRQYDVVWCLLRSCHSFSFA
jgi:hypothetical protein